MDKYWVSMTDRFMSGWGKTEGRINKLVLSCYSYSEALTVKENAENRSDMEDIEIFNSKPSYDENQFFVSWEGQNEGTYENWFKPGFFDPEPKMSKREIENAKGKFLNIIEVFSKPTGTTLEKLHNDAVTERLIRLLQTRHLTAKQSAEIVFKLTDAEKLNLLSEASMRGPLSRECIEEMQRLFYKVYGENAYSSIFGYRSPPEKEDWVDIWGKH